MDTETKWRARVVSWRASGATAAEYSRRHGYSASSLRAWASKLGRESDAGARRRGVPEVRMAQLVRTPVTEPRRGAVVVELLDARVRIAIEAGADAATLATVLAVLATRGAA